MTCWPSGTWSPEPAALAVVTWLADVGGRADVLEGDVGVLPLVPLVLQRSVGRCPDDQESDGGADADDGEAAALLGALLLLTDLVDDRLAVGLGGLGCLGHG